MADIDAEVLDSLKIPAGEVDSKKKYISFPKGSGDVYNKLVELMKDAEETPALLESYLSGGEEAEEKNEALSEIIAKLKDLIKDSDGPTKEMLEKELARQEKKMGKGRKIALNFVLVFLLSTNSYKEIQELAPQIA